MKTKTITYYVIVVTDLRDGRMFYKGKTWWTYSSAFDVLSGNDAYFRMDAVEKRCNELQEGYSANFHCTIEICKHTREVID